jgi:hypothetical protein
VGVGLGEGVGLGVGDGVGLGDGVGVGLGEGLGVGDGVAVGLGVGEGVGVGEHGDALPTCAQYAAPVLSHPVLPAPPQTIIWPCVSAHTAVCCCRPVGALTGLVFVQ